jgi:hypothetical protein
LHQKGRKRLKNVPNLVPQFGKERMSLPKNAAENFPELRLQAPLFMEAFLKTYSKSEFHLHRLEAS